MSSAVSVASNIQNAVQQATQTIVQPPAVFQPPPVVQPPAVVPVLPVEPFVPAMPIAAAETPAAGIALTLPTLLAPPAPPAIAVLDGEATRGIDVIPPALADEAGQTAPAVVPIRPGTSFFSPPPAAPAPESSAARAAAAPPQAHPTQRHTSDHVPLRLPRDPIAPPAQLSVAPAASGPGSTGGVGLAILVGALLAASSQTARWLRAVRTRQPQAPVFRRPERPD